MVTSKTNRSARVRQTVLMGLLFAMAMVLSYVGIDDHRAPGCRPGSSLGCRISSPCTASSSSGDGRPTPWRCSRASLPCSPRGFTAACMSTAGGLVSVTVMLVLIRLKRLDLSYTLISVCGSLGHNFGQLAMASVIMQSGFVIYYLPIMAVSGIGMGVATGVILRVMLPYMNKLRLTQS